MTLTATEIERVSSLIQGLIDADVSALSRDALLDQAPGRWAAREGRGRARVEVRGRGGAAF
ncbi:hypothetical protein [Demequina litorisediminis]|uniref:hypothetical protein n=1 Tax=Demequina litorisediminis TaxID=1849022 RepID=UPI0024E0CD0B|nr:hypothetical protein [Demequina litorisediminis]